MTTLHIRGPQGEMTSPTPAALIAARTAAAARLE